MRSVGTWHHGGRIAAVVFVESSLGRATHSAAGAEHIVHLHGIIALVVSLEGLGGAVSSGTRRRKVF